jgi:hypothetical protein
MTLVATAVEASPITIDLSTTPNVQDFGNGTFTINDTATVSSGFAPTGLLTFQLSNPSNITVYTNVITVNGAGDYSTAFTGNNPGGYFTTTTGSYLWTVNYSGDANNAPIEGHTERFTVGEDVLVPEPSSLALLGIAAVAGGLRRWRRRQAA